MMDIMDHLLEDAAELIRCETERERARGPLSGAPASPPKPSSNGDHLCNCAPCEWRRNYRKYVRDRENGELAALAQRIQRGENP